MLSRTLVIAFNTYREAVRARIMLGLAALALATSLYSIAVGEFALHAGSRVVADVGAASMSLYAVVASVVMGATSLHRELEQKTIFPILARPLLRAEYIVGKYLGTLLTLAVFIALDAAAVLTCLAHHGGRSFASIAAFALGSAVALGLGAWKSRPFRTYGPIAFAPIAVFVAARLAGSAVDDARVVLACGALSLFEVMIVSAIAMLFSAFSSPFLTAVLTFGLFIVGRSTDTLARLPLRVFGSALKRAGVLLSKVLPNLHVYVPPRPLLTGEVPGSSLSAYLGLAFLQAVGWTVGLVVAAHFLFRRRDLV